MTKEVRYIVDLEGDVEADLYALLNSVDSENISDVTYNAKTHTLTVTQSEEL